MLNIQTKVGNPIEILPAGKYWIGDPVYLFDDKTWALIAEGFYGEHNVYLTFYNWCTGILHQTKDGDGLYVDQHNREYIIDSGIISVIPETIFNNFEPFHQEKGLSVVFNKNFRVVHEKDYHIFDDLYIMLKTSEENVLLSSDDDSNLDLLSTFSHDMTTNTIPNELSEQDILDLSRLRKDF